MTCPICQKPVEPVAVALTQFRCLACLAARFNTTTERLMDAARRYRDGGCVLFKGFDLK